MTILLVALLFLTFAAHATLFQVGPTRAKTTLQSVAGALHPGDIVEVDGNTVYAGGITFLRDGSSNAPITIRGLRVNGHRPVISGTNLPSFAGLVAFRADHYIFEGFELDASLNTSLLRGIYHAADDVTIRDTLLHHCAYLGIHGSDSAGSLTLDNVEVHHCGSGESYHQIYVASDNTRYPNAVFRMQFCFVHDGKGGNNVKSRVGRNEIYYNWIEGAYYHELDLIGADPAAQVSDTASLVREDFDVVGNVLLKMPASFGVVARLGTDGTGSSNGRYRFVNNTIILSTNYATYTLRVRGPRQSVELHNNVFAHPGGGILFVDSADPALGAGDGFFGANNFLPAGTLAIPAGITGTRTNSSPRFADEAGFDFTPAAGSLLLDAAGPPTQSPVDFPFINPLAAPQFLPPLRMAFDTNAPTPRASDGEPDIGAFEAASLPPAFLTQPVSTTRLQGQPFTFAAFALGSLTDLNPLQYQWLHDGGVITDATNTSLVFGTAQTNDAGIYALVVTNMFGAATSSPALLAVNPDTVKPAVIITAPANMAVFTGELATLIGTASDSARVSAVLISRDNTNAWLPVANVVQPTPPLMIWSNPLALAPGTNSVFVKAVDFAGNESTTLARSFFRSVPLLFTLQINGSGSVISLPTAVGTPTNGAMLELTRRFSVTAIPGANCLFSNWLVSVNGGPTTEVSTLVKYVFTMQSNLVLTAQFVTNRFTDAAGSYSGLFSDPSRVTPVSAGFFTVKTDNRQRFTGKLSFAGEVVPISGGFDLAGDGVTARPVVLRQQPGSLTVRLHLPFDGSDTISGSVSNNTSGWFAPLRGDRAVFSPATNPAVFAGTYTLMIPGAPDATLAPGGVGFGTVSIGSNGVLAFLGTLGDGQAVRQSAPVSRNGDWPLFATAQAGAEMVFGWLTVSNHIGGPVAWLKNPVTNDAFYPTGFTLALEVSGERYTSPAVGVRGVGWTNGSILLTDGNLSGPLSNSLTLSTLNRFAAPTNYGLKLAYTVKSGRLTGSFKHPDNTNAVTALAGVVVQGLDEGYGFFKGTNQTGAFWLRGN